MDGDVSGTVIHGVGERVPEQPDGLLLAVGGSPARADTLDAIRQAGAARYCGVVIKAQGEDYSAAVYEANAAGVCLLITPDDVPWRYLDALVTSVLGASAWAATPAYEAVPTGDLFELANAIACSVGGATTIEDPRGRVLAHSSLPHQETDEARQLSILHRQPPYRPGGAAAYEKVRQSRGVVRLGSNEASHWDRLAIAVRAGGAVLGLLWVLDSNPPLDDEAEADLEEAARVAALHLVRARGVQRSHQWGRRAALTALLEGRVSEKAAGEQLGMGPEIPTTVLAIGQSADAYIKGLDSERVVDLVGLYCEALHPQAMCAASGETVYAIVPTHEGGGPAPARLARFAEDVAHAVQRTTAMPVHVGIAGPAPRLGEVPACRRTADLVLEALALHADRTEVATVEGVHSRVVLLELLERGAAAIVLPADPVQEILTYDQRHTTTYGESLLVYLDAFGEASKAAAALSIHENTLRYRIRRIQELFGLDLSDAETRLVTWLRLHLQQISK
ncbi:helix-turn-helix domain-containing protein [Streptomyces sp. RS2]|uniref:PucR family transcriptional regulator n=1 Tax=Streptomyces sp. RS2 TaxID=1451205 RepID=UPI0021F87CC3|nr:helix-turn-helix domain-containing protein [Streptomyces sp. RS2]MCW1100191.1 helix-turn-helix domain-containing protein [Streptomyces sp. RS2]